MGLYYDVVEMNRTTGYVGIHDDLGRGAMVVGTNDRTYPLATMHKVAELLSGTRPEDGKVRVTMSADMVGFLKANVEAAIAHGNLDGLSEEEAEGLKAELTATWLDVRDPDADPRYEAIYSHRGEYWYVDLRLAEGGSTVIGAGGEDALTEEMAEDIARALDNTMAPSGHAHVDMTLDQARFARRQVRVAGNMGNYDFEGGSVCEEDAMTLEDRIGEAIEGETLEEHGKFLEDDGTAPRM